MSEEFKHRISRISRRFRVHVWAIAQWRACPGGVARRPMWPGTRVREAQRAVRPDFVTFSGPVSSVVQTLRAPVTRLGDLETSEHNTVHARREGDVRETRHR